MKTMFWLAVAVSVGVAFFIVRHVMRKLADRERESEARAAQLLAQLAGAKPSVAPPAPAVAAVAAAPASNSLETQKLLFEAARKAGEAGEPAIALELYDRLLTRFPDSGFAGEARAAAQTQKKRLNRA